MSVSKIPAIAWLPLIWLAVSVSLVACNKKTEKEKEEKKHFPYDISKPNQDFVLPKDLKNLSGLSYLGDGTLLCTRHDNSKVYSINVQEKTMGPQYDFLEKKGDYEGVEIVQDDAYILLKNGFLFEVKDFLTEEKSIKKYSIADQGVRNAEGLGFDKKHNYLLIANKEAALDHKGDSASEKRVVYAFNLHTSSFLDTPYLEIYSHIVKDTYPDYHNFIPSGVAVNPISQDVYVLSSTGHLMLVLDSQGKLMLAKELDKTIFNDPEGICFSNDGTLYIANLLPDSTVEVKGFEYLYAK